MEASLLDEIDLHHANGTARGALHRKVIDIGHLDVVDVEGIFQGTAAADDEAVGLVVDLRQTRQALEDAADVAAGSWGAADFLERERGQTEGVLFFSGKVARLDGHIGDGE
ncbi:MAG: hypothetical protein BWY77_01899 [bacterium ADurb.Bin431]|nr:MAG: hypothetical protein BWY77_01899 [bacterium ADurb.Bin431]